MPEWELDILLRQIRKQLPLILFGADGVKSDSTSEAKQVLPFESMPTRVGG